MVGTQRQHQRPARGHVRRQRGEEPLPLSLVLAHRDRLLGLVHDEDLPSTGLQSGQRLRRTDAGGGEQDRCPVAGQRGDDAGADQRGLADTRRPDHGQDAHVAQLPQARRHVGFAAEERVGVLGVVRKEAAVGTDRADLSPQDRIQGRVLTQQQLLELDELATGIQAELFDEHLPRVRECGQGLCLPARLVQGSGEQRPAPLPERRLRDECPGLGQHVARVTGVGLRLHAQLLRVHAQSLEPCRLHAPGFPLLQIGAEPVRATGPAPPARGTTSAPDRPRPGRPGTARTAARSAGSPAPPRSASTGNPPLPTRWRQRPNASAGARCTRARPWPTTPAGHRPRARPRGLRWSAGRRRARRAQRAPRGPAARARCSGRRPRGGRARRCPCRRCSAAATRQSTALLPR